MPLPPALAARLAKRGILKTAVVENGKLRFGCALTMHRQWLKRRQGRTASGQKSDGIIPAFARTPALYFTSSQFSSSSCSLIRPIRVV